MISPHAQLRERGIFLCNVDADRERRAKGLPDLGRETETQKRPTGSDTLMRELRARIRRAIQTSYFTGG